MVTPGVGGLKRNMAFDEDEVFKRHAVAGEYLTREQLERCMAVQNRTVGRRIKPLGEIAIEQGLVTGQELGDLYAGKRKPRPVRTIGGYEIVAVLGEGGLGTVYRARQMSMKRDVALKVLHAKWNDDREFRQRFLLEARMVGKMSHQNLIQVFDVGMDGEQLYFSMEFVAGKNVQQIIDAGPLDTNLAIDIVVQTCRAINYFKDFGVVHRDVKPSNILVNPQGVAKLGDFGFIKTKIDKDLSSDGYILGTPDYISPEQARWEDDLDYRSDIYSLGATFYHMLTGVTPFMGTESAVIRQHMKMDFPSPLSYRAEMSEDLVIILERMMAKKREDRYSDLGQLCDELVLVKIGQHPTSTRLEPGKSTILREVDLQEKRVQRLENERRSLKLKIDHLEASNRQMRGLIAVLVVALAILGIALAVRL